MRISSLTPVELQSRLGELFSLERKTTAQIVECLLAIESRRLYLGFGYSSLYQYLTKHFRHTEGTAQRWIDCVKMTKLVPEIQSDLECGKVNQTQVCIMAGLLREKSKQDNLNPEIIRAKAVELLPQIRHRNVAQTQVIVSKILNVPIKKFEKMTHQQDESVRFEITLSKEQLKRLERVKEIFSHLHPSLSMSELISVMAEEVIKRRDPARTTQRTAGTGQAAEPICRTKITQRTEPRLRRTPTSKVAVGGGDLTAETESKREMPTVTKSIPPGTKSIPRATLRAVHQRDRSCQWKTQGRQCDSRFQLQVDHIKPRWAGGGHELSNLQLLCGVHNREKYRLESGVRSGVRIQFK